MKLAFLVYIFTASFTALASSNAEVTATVDRNQIGIGDVINFSISVSAANSVNVEEPQLPAIRGLELINTSTGVETRSSYSNGRFITEQARNFHYMLAAQAAGTVTIPAIPVSVDGNSYQTKPITIVISGTRSVQPRADQRGRGGRGQPDPFSLFDEQDEELFRQMLQRNFPGAGGGLKGQAPINPNEAFFIQAEVDKAKAYVGEQITVSFYLYTRGQIQDIDTLKYPDLKGFWKEELEMATRLNFEQQVINGIAYQRAMLVSYALFPIKAGKAKIDPYKAKCTVLTPSTFGFGRPYQFTKVSREIDIEVKDLPTDGRPSNFTGAVGRFRLSSKFEPPTGVVNQPVTLRVRIDGQGNAKLIELPNLNLPPSFEMYDQKSQAKFLKDGNSYKEFEVLIIPHEAGVFNIPPVSIAAFDPETGKFTNVASQPLSLTVTGTALSPSANIPSAPERRDVVRVDQLPPLSHDMGSSNLSTAKMLGITVGIYAFVFGFLGLTAWRGLRLKPKKVSLRNVLKRRVNKVQEYVNSKDYRRVGVEITNTTYYIIGQLSGTGGAGVGIDQLLEKSAPSLRRELSESIKNILDQGEALSFAPESLISGLTEKTKINALVVNFEKVLNQAIELEE